MSTKVKQFIAESGRSMQSYTIEESEAGQLINCRMENNVEYSCLIDDDELRKELIAYLKENGARVIAMPSIEEIRKLRQERRNH